MTPAEKRYRNAHGAVLHTFNPTPAQELEFEQAEAALKDEYAAKENNMPDVFYSRRGSAIVISQPFQPDIVLDEGGLRLAIDNVKRNRHTYVSDEAWRKHLAMYEGAADFLSHPEAREQRDP